VYSSLMTWTGYFRDRLATKLRRLHRVGGKRRSGIPAVGDRATRMSRAGPEKAAGDFWSHASRRASSGSLAQCAQ
jgi:hypothetical protein